MRLPGSEAAEMIDDDLGPGLQLGAHGLKLCQGVKAEVLDGVFVGLDVVAARGLLDRRSCRCSES